MQAFEIIPSEKFDMQKFTLTLLFLFVLFCVQCAAHTNIDDTSEIPFTFEKGYVIVQAQIKRQMPVEMVLATGAEYSTFDGSIINKYKLSLNFTFDNPKACNNPDCTYIFSNVTDISLGDLKLVSLSMRLGSLESIKKRIGREVFGVLGADFFKGRVVQFDFVKKIVRFLPQSPNNSVKDNQTGKTANGRVVILMGFYREDITLPIVENVVFDGKKIRTVFDTGTAMVVALSPAATKQLGRTSPPEKSVARVDKISVLRFDDYELTDVPVALYAKGMGFDRDVKEFGAIAGTGLLQNFVVTFNFRSKIIILKHI